MHQPPLESRGAVPFVPQRQAPRTHGQMQPQPMATTERVKCLHCPRYFDRLTRPKGRHTVYCSKSCRNYASRARVADRFADPVGVARFREQQARMAQRRAAPAPDLSAVIARIPELAQVLQVVESDHGHEALRRAPAESVTGAPAHPTASRKTQPVTNHARRAKGTQNE